MICHVCGNECVEGYFVPVDDNGDVVYTDAHDGVSMPCCPACYEEREQQANLQKDSRMVQILFTRLQDACRFFSYTGSTPCCWFVRGMFSGKCVEERCPLLKER